VALLSLVLPKFAIPPCQYYWCPGIGMYHAVVPFNDMLFIKTSVLHTQTQWRHKSLFTSILEKKNRLINDRKATRKGSCGDSQTSDPWRMIKAVKRIVTTDVHSESETGLSRCSALRRWNSSRYWPECESSSRYLRVDIIVHMLTN
jgi:hypothetical protein